MTAPRPLAQSWAAVLAERLRVGGWACLSCLDLAKGRWQRLYRSNLDKRVTALKSGNRQRQDPNVYRFADDEVDEVEVLAPPLIGDDGQEFESLQELAAAIIAHDDEREWLRAGSKSAGAT